MCENVRCVKDDAADISLRDTHLKHALTISSYYKPDSLILETS